MQWFDDKHIIFNTAQDNKAVSKIINIENGEVKNLSLPIDSVYNAAGKSLLTSFSYERLQRCMSGYGYPYSDESFLNECAPSQTGLFIYDINTQSKRLLVSLKELAKYDDEDSVSDYLNFVTHTQFSKDGRFICFLYRKTNIKEYSKRITQMMVYDLDNDKLIVLPTQKSGSHFVWNNKNQIISSNIIDGKSCHVLFDVNCPDNYKIIAIDKLNSDGHHTFVDDDNFIVDTYPDKYRMAKLYKVNISTQNVEKILDIYSPKAFQTVNEQICHKACDLHPRTSPDGKFVCFDSPIDGKRSLCVMKI